MSAARRWLARNAAGVRLISSTAGAAASACVSLVTCLPALESVGLCLLGPLHPDDFGCLLEALAWCQRLRVLRLWVREGYEGNYASWPSSDMPALAKLRSLTKLRLCFGDPAPCTLPGVVSALAQLTGLAKLEVYLPVTMPGHQPVAVPAALGQLKGLRKVKLYRLNPCVLEAGCLDLPNLQSLVFGQCEFSEAEVLPGATALQSLTRIEFSSGQCPHTFDHQLVQLPRLRIMIYAPYTWERDIARVGPARLPADMGSLTSSLVLCDFRGCGLTQFPVALTQLRALVCLRANRNEFTELPAAISALSRLTELMLGRMKSLTDPLQLHEQHPLDACALGDLSGFPALCKLEFESCEAMLCDSMLGAVRHASLTSLSFRIAHPAPECALVVLRLSQALKRARRGGVLTLEYDPQCEDDQAYHDQHYAHALAPYHKFKGALEACGL